MPRLLLSLVLVLAVAAVTCQAAAKKRKKFEADFEFADDAVSAPPNKD